MSFEVKGRKNDNKNCQSHCTLISIQAFKELDSLYKCVWVYDCGINSKVYVIRRPRQCCQICLSKVP